ncbi:DUF1016 N-terminal domain-containing protein [Spirosoma sordidisoli]|uniref:DUF1016 family protein n=1 Tax=Spirosoma sordidisoli TaxID=2502893 RepID=A0A4Q2UGW6_9BACT|nr:DUF1016 N-terminal domain-containing protein [Spirosoma sordidisoli]RYC66520.1 DUF1016 family protein [Spirosoma sordidisoli]
MDKRIAMTDSIAQETTHKTESQPESNPESFVELHEYLRQLLSPQQEALRGEPDFARVEAYWHIGRIIVETEQQGQGRADYGIHLVESLADELTQHYGKGYKTSNLWWFKQFYLVFPILHAVRGEFRSLREQLRTELTWTHYRLLIAIENKQERHFYLHNAADESWSYRTLNRLIKSRYYYQVALGEDQLLSTRTAPKKVNQAEKHRSRVAQIRRLLLDQPGWAFVERTGSGLPMTILKPDIFFYQYNLQRFVGIWLAENTPNLLESIRQQLAEWQPKQPATILFSPLALLVNAQNKSQLITTAMTPALSENELSQLPKQL